MRQQFLKQVSMVFTLLIMASPVWAEKILVGAFDVGPGGDPQAILYQGRAGYVWHSKMYTPLVMMTADYSGYTSEGALAVKWEANAENTIWTFTLRNGVKWHDGAPFTAHDLKFTAEFIANPSVVTVMSSPFRIPGKVVGYNEFREGKATEITGIVIVDDLTLQVHLTEPSPRFPGECRLWFALPKHAINFPPADVRTTDWWWTRPIGTGPFKFGAYKKDEYMELVPNEYYWDGKPKLDKLVNRYFPDVDAAAVALENGEIDFSYVTPDVSLRFGANPNFQVFEGSSFVTNLLNYNYRRPIWRDIRVRQAMLYGIDRATILRDVFKDGAQAVPCGDPYPMYWPADVNAYDYHPEKARELLAAAAADGVSLEGQTFEILTYYTAQFDKDVLNYLQANLAEIGIQVTPIYLSLAEWKPRVHEKGEFDLAYRGWGEGIDYIGTDWYVKGNEWGIDDPAYETLSANMHAASAPEDYKNARMAYCAYQNTQAAFGYLWVATRYGAASARLKDFHYYPAPGGGPYVDHAEKWDIAE